MKIFLSCLLLPPPYFFIPLIIYLLQYSLSFGKYYITRSFRGSAPLLRAPVVGWEAIQAPRALQAPGPFRYCRGLWPPGPFRHCGSLWPHFHYNIVIFHIHYFIFMKIGRQFPNHPGGMSHGTLLFLYWCIPWRSTIQCKRWIKIYILYSPAQMSLADGNNKKIVIEIQTEILMLI